MAGQNPATIFIQIKIKRMKSKQLPSSKELYTHPNNVVGGVGVEITKDNKKYFIQTINFQGREYNVYDDKHNYLFSFQTHNDLKNWYR